MKRRFAMSAFVLVAVTMAAAQRMPTVTYTVSQLGDDLVFDFSLTNNLLPGEGVLYFFGVYVETGRNIVASPFGWDPNAWTSWNNVTYGGSNIDYNNVWLGTSDQNYGQPGQTLTGFKVLMPTSRAPQPIDFAWFAYGLDGYYEGNDFFNTNSNPGFEGRASAVPEPASIGAVLLGVAALLRSKRR